MARIERGTHRSQATPTPAAANRMAAYPSDAPPRSAPSGFVDRGDAGRLRPLLDAIRQVESAGNDRAVGDAGRSIGPYQIGLAYWRDGGGDPGRYLGDAWSAAACEVVMLTYWRRHCPAAMRTGDFETLARVHNGGPRGATKPSTLPYWRRVRAATQEK